MPAEEGGEGQRARRRDTEVPRQPQLHAPARGRERGEAGNARVALREGSPGLNVGQSSRTGGGAEGEGHDDAGAEEGKRA